MCKIKIEEKKFEIVIWSYLYISLCSVWGIDNIYGIYRVIMYMFNMGIGFIKMVICICINEILFKIWFK